MLGLASALAFASPTPLTTPDFSADIVTRDAAGTVRNAGARLYVSNGKVRIETPEATTGFFLIDSQSTTALFVRPAQRIFMDARQSTRLTQLFLPIDPTSPCDRWQAAAKNAGAPEAGDDWHCERVGASRAVEYRVGSAPENSTQRWIDPKLSFPVKVRTADGTTLELEHIKKEPQPAQLFAVPTGFHKLDPQALINRIKQSDVWVEPPKAN
jgi:hypothetical protein